MADEPEEEKIDFDKEADAKVEETELTYDDMLGPNYLKTPAVGETLKFKVTKVINNPRTSAKNKTTQKTFDIGLKDRHGNIKRTDIHSAEGIYTVSSWEVFFKLFGKDGLLMAYAKKHDNKFAGATIEILRTLDGSHSSMKIGDLAKIRSCKEEEAVIYQKTVQNAIKEKKLYEVKVS